MGKLRKIGMTLLTIIAALTVFLAGFYLFLRPWYYRLWYSGPRVSGTVRVEMDGEVYHLRADDFSTYDGPHMRDELHVRVNKDGSAKVSIMAGDYGLYKFILQPEGLDRPLAIGSYQFNWWNVTRFELFIRIDRASGTVYFESTAKELDESGNWYSESDSYTFDLSEEEIEYWVVSV